MNSTKFVQCVQKILTTTKATETKLTRKTSLPQRFSINAFQSVSNERSFSTANETQTRGAHYLKEECPRFLITGSLGQLGPGLAKLLREKYGRESVIMSDIRKPSKSILQSGPFIYADVLDMKALEEIIVNYGVDCLIHFGALLSARSEQNLQLAMKVNLEGVHNVILLAKQFQMKLFVPSTIAAFGLTSPRNPTPDICIQRPRTIYGLSKVHLELLGEYVHEKFNIDFRSLRFPGIISADILMGGGTTDYAVEMFHDAILYGKYECFLAADTLLPMMYIDDCLRSTVEFIEAANEDLLLRTYNITAFSFSPAQLAAAIKRYIPHFEVIYKPDFRQAIAETWPQVIDDSNARRDWKWCNEYDLERLCETMIMKLAHKYNRNDLLKKCTTIEGDSVELHQSSAL